MSRIAILTHENDNFYGDTYILKDLSEIWKENGHSIEVVKGTAKTTEADLAFNHVDVTETPDEYLKFAGMFPRVINGAVIDISKRFISSNICRAGEAVDGPVIVKTNLNCGGIPEASLRWRTAPPETIIQEKLTSLRNLKTDWSKVSLMQALDYPVFDSVEAVPLEIWTNPNLVVERFVAERKDDFYCVRIWIFFGDRETNTLAYSNQKVAKSATIVHREPIQDVPDELRERRKELGFDFGKFDYVMIDGKAVLLDANRTPTQRMQSRESTMPGLLELAKGLNGFLE